MKTPTLWSSATKQQTDWTAARRSATSWANNDVKAATQYTETGHTATDWNVPPAIQQTYFYDDINRSYDSAEYEYDYIVDGNTLSNRNRTAWSAA